MATKKRKKLSLPSFIRRAAIGLTTLGLLAGIVVPRLVAAANIPAPFTTWPSVSSTPIQKALNDIIADGKLGGEVSVHDSYLGDWTGVAGVSDPNTNAPVDPNSHFRVASVSKTFVAVTTLQLIQEGKLSLSDKLDTLLPGAVTYKDPSFSGQITVEQLLNMRSGLCAVSFPYYPTFYSKSSWTPQELVNTSNAQGNPCYTPDSQYFYSNTNYTLLAMIIEKITGHFYGDEIQNRIITPLQLTGTSVPTTRVIPTPTLKAYVTLSNGPAEISGQEPSIYYGMGQMISTTKDMNTFMAALLGGRLLDATRLAAMTKVQPTDAGGLFNFFGLGIDRRELRCGVTIWARFGGINGWQTVTAISDNGTRQVSLAYTDYTNSTDFSVANQHVLDMLDTAFCKVPVASIGNAPDTSSSLNRSPELMHTFTKRSDGALTSLKLLHGTWSRYGDGTGFSAAPTVMSSDTNDLREYGTSAQKLWWVQLEQASATWQPTGIPSKFAPFALTVGPGEDYIFTVNPANNHLLRANNSGSSWTSQDLGGSASTPPVAFTTAPGYVDVFYRHAGDNKLGHTYLRNGHWYNEVINTVITSTPSAVTYGPDYAKIFARNASNQIAEVSYVAGKGWVTTTLGSGLASAPIIATNGTGHLSLFVRNTSNQLVEYYYSGGAWHTSNHGGGIIGAPSVIATNSLSKQGAYILHIMAQSSNSYMYDMQYNGGWKAWQRVQPL